MTDSTTHLIKRLTEWSRIMDGPTLANDGSDTRLSVLLSEAASVVARLRDDLAEQRAFNESVTATAMQKADAAEAEAKRLRGENADLIALPITAAAETVFAVFKQGVYRHECGGIFTSLEEAVACARALAVADRDDYHNYAVVPFALNHQTPRTSDPDAWADDLEEAARVFYCRKGFEEMVSE